MNLKINTHFMPWEVDHALLIADKLKESIYYINSTDTVYINSALNLSSYIIDWNSSKISKQFFIDKYCIFNEMLNKKFKVSSYIYDGDELYGCLDLQRNSIKQDDNIDYYMSLCPDIHFSSTLLFYFIESMKQIKNKYCIITPQISRCWDNSWDFLVNNNFKNIDYKNYCHINSHELHHIIKQKKEDVVLTPINMFKFSGWCDIYNKNFMENLVPILPNWNGYGPWDLYSMNVSTICKQHNVDIQQYILENEIIWFYDSGDLHIPNTDDGLLKQTYKKYLKINLQKKEQRLLIDNNINQFINDWYKNAKTNNIL